MTTGPPTDPSRVVAGTAPTVTYVGDMRTVTRVSQLTLAAALGLSLAACGSSSSSGSSAPASAGGATSAAGASGGSASSAGPSAGGSSSAPSAATSAATSGSAQAGVPDATTLVHRARAAYPKAKSAHLHIKINDASQNETIDIKGNIAGTNQEVQLAEAGKGSATLRTVSGKTYIKADRKFWTTSGGLPANVAAKTADKWIISPPSASKQFASVTIKNFLDQVLSKDSLSDSDLAKASSTKSSLDGKDVYVITDHSDEGGSLTLAADSTYVLRLLPPDKQRDEGALTMDGWNQQPTVSAPSGAVDPQSIR